MNFIKDYWGWPVAIFVFIILPGIMVSNFGTGRCSSSVRYHNVTDEAVGIYRTCGLDVTGNGWIDGWLTFTFGTGAVGVFPGLVFAFVVIVIPISTIGQLFWFGCRALWNNFRWD